MINDDITIRAIQHYLYCPHRWGLMEIDRAWSENYFVTKANIIHKRVHTPNNGRMIRNKKIYTSVPVYNDMPQYRLYGVLDSIEINENDNVSKKRRVCIVEYKPTMPKGKLFREDDLMQVFAQKICADYVFECDCIGEIYYADAKKRIKLPLTENYSEYDSQLKKILEEMRGYLRKGEVPKINANQKCGGCSMRDLCMPKVVKKSSVRLEIETIERMENEKTSEYCICDK